jgi:uncharacterized protein (TIGR02996 family)
VDEPALLRAIIADPADDTVRLAYADWLDEHDEADRAEFIRVQIELARLPDADPRRSSLTAREEALFNGLRLGRLRREAPAELAPYVGQQCIDYRRGFLACVSFGLSSETVTEFRAAAPSLFAHAPVEELLVWGVPVVMDWNDYWNGTQPLGYLDPETVRDLAEVPELARLSMLTVTSPAERIDALCRVIIASPYLRKLRRLHIRNRYRSFESLNGLNRGENELLVDQLAPATQAELRAAFGDRVVWDA